MSTALLQLPSDVYIALHRHLLREHHAVEEAAFVFAKRDDNTQRWQYVDWLPVLEDGFVVQLPYHFELADHIRAQVIKRAHDLGASIVEFHAHTNGGEAEFSPSDWSGFEEIVPHIWWRLKGRAYGAVVMSHLSFDGFVWITGPATPQRIGGLVVGERVLRPTGLSPLERDGYDWTF